MILGEGKAFVELLAPIGLLQRRLQRLSRDDQPHAGPFAERNPQSHRSPEVFSSIVAPRGLQGVVNVPVNHVLLSKFSPIGVNKGLDTGILSLNTTRTFLEVDNQRNPLPDSRRVDAVVVAKRKLGPQDQGDRARPQVRVLDDDPVLPLDHENLFEKDVLLREGHRRVEPRGVRAEPRLHQVLVAVGKDAVRVATGVEI